MKYITPNNDVLEWQESANTTMPAVKPVDAASGVLNNVLAIAAGIVFFKFITRKKKVIAKTKA